MLERRIICNLPELVRSNWCVAIYAGAIGLVTLIMLYRSALGYG